MELFEYIKSQLPQMPNTVIMKQLGASQELIDYIKETPENTNFAIAEVIGGSGGGDIGEVWLVGENEEGSGSFPLRNNGTTDYMVMLYINAENYQVFINGEELPYFIQATSRTCIWADSDAEVTTTKFVSITKAEDADEYSAEANYIDPSTAPDSVEVSVKAK